MTKHTCLSFVLFVAAACGDDGDDPEIPVQNRAVIVAGDFAPGAPGVMSALDLDIMEVEQQVAPTGSVDSDPVIRRFGTELFIVNRGANNVTILDAITFELVEQLATGAGSNPQDVTVVGDELYVPAFGTAGVVVIQRGTGATRTIDLSALDTVDGQPDCASVIEVDDEVYVACGRLDNFVATLPGVVAVLDTVNADAVTTFELTHPNPFGLFQRMPLAAGGELVISTVPDFSDFSTGCVERIDLEGSPTASCSITNQELGGLPGRIDFEVVGESVIQWMVVSSFGANGQVGNVQGLDLTTNEHIAALTPDTQILVDLAVCPGNLLVVSDATLAANGLRVYGGQTEITTAPLAVGLKPGNSNGLICY